MRTPASCITLHPSRFTLHVSRSQRGVALVVTLLLLSIITFMTVTFLVVSRSQKGSVVSETDQAVARLAADMALERAKAELLAPILAATNEFGYGLLVSTNYISSGGFVSGFSSPYNVSYNYSNGTLLNLNDSLQNLTNMIWNPRPPVFIVTNRLLPNFYDFRFYLDLNRNGRYDTNGFLPVIGANGLPTGVSDFFVGDPEWIGGLERPEFQHSADNKFVNRYAYIAIPAGNTLDVNAIHNYAKWSLGQSQPTLVAGDGFLRDQGVGTWEINLAAFLVDLNTNLWPFSVPNTLGFAPYNYFANPAIANTGTAFEDAVAFMRYRYATNWHALASVSTLFTNGANAFLHDGIDGYSAAIMPNISGFPLDPDGSPVNLTGFPWSGGGNPNHFFTTQDLFDNSKTASMLKPNQYSFITRLNIAGAQTNSYDRYTFYRLLSQLGTDSAPEPAGKLNLNYCNVDNNGNVVPNMATNFFPWTNAVQFLTNAAIRLLANAGYSAGVGPTNLLYVNYVNGAWVTNLWIQLWPTNFYTPSVHRLLQLAANIYDASTVRMVNGVAVTNIPSVFRPVFKVPPSGNQVFIGGYQEVQDASVLNSMWPPIDLSIQSNRRTLMHNPNQIVWGVPLVIGAKKGLPNFNKLAMQTQVQVCRKLQFHRQGNSNTGPINEIDQMFTVGVTNTFGVEAWNSYATNFPRSLRMVVIPELTVAVTNLETRKLLNPATSSYVSPGVPTTIPANAWQGYNPGREGLSFVLPLASGPGVPYTNIVFVSNATYSASSDTFVPLTGIFERTPGTTNLHVPHWQLNLRTRLYYALVDSSLTPNRIVDCVNLDSTETPVDITDALMHDNPSSYSSCGPNATSYQQGSSDGSMWCTNRPGNSTDDSVETYGIMNQIAASLGLTSPDWNFARQEFPAGMSKDQAIAFFKAQFTPPGSSLFQTNTFAAPFQPFRNVYKLTEWQANDPLVHYTIGDLKNPQSTNTFDLDPGKSLLVSPLTSLGQINPRYEPWGGNPKKYGVGVNAPAYELRVKDPVASNRGRSDDWDFPTNKFPNVGWLGRVHRGTPWQTIYLKSSPTDLGTWMNWTGNAASVTNLGQFSTNMILPRSAVYYPVPTTATITFSNGVAVYDAVFTHPTNDWHILDLFTTALSDNATRGQLSINQTNLAAWSAVLSGVVVLTNTPSGILDANGNPTPAPGTIQPAGVYDAFNTNTWPPLVRIVNGINKTRASAYVVGTNVFPVFRNQSFQTLGDILSVPELTVASPFLNPNSTPTNDVNYALSDAACERIPQQILGLLKCDHTPRFVVYSFGQALKPADHSLVTSGPFFGLCTNYQIMAEAATRAVIRIDGAPANPHAVIESFNVLPPD
jgi:hypothetical protein